MGAGEEEEISEWNREVGGMEEEGGGGARECEKV